MKVIAFLGYRLVEAKVSVAKSGIMYVVCPNQDATGTRPEIPGLSKHSKMVGTYASLYFVI